MYTQCPHCQTLFRISAEQLEAAAGQAHCCRCDRVFDAQANLREPQTDEEWPDSCPIDDAPEQQNLELPFDTPLADEGWPEAHSNLTELMQALQIAPQKELPESNEPTQDEQLAMDDERDPFEPPFIVDDPEMDSIQIGLDSQLHDIVDTASGSVAPVQPTPIADATLEQESASATLTGENIAAPAPFDIPDNLPEIRPTEAVPLSMEETLHKNATHNRRGTLGWSLAIILLLTAALGQLAWFGRDHLLRYPAGRELLERACELLSCQLPPRHEPEKIQVLSRTITSHPDKANALLVTLSLRNDGDFAQAWPQIELSLLDRNGALVARRSFGPEEYRNTTGEMLEPGIPQSLRLELADPGDQVVGFQFDFH